jgi:2-methylisocitrate lyase-like PEP mutase family enzyme
VTRFVAGCFDAMSAMLAEKAGAPAVMTSGFAVSAAHLGFPDVELYTMTENLAVVRNVANAVSVPVVADTDTGYGNAINVMRTVREFEQAGVSAMIFEDQIRPQTLPRRRQPARDPPAYEHAGKIRAAVPPAVTPTR